MTSSQSSRFNKGRPDALHDAPTYIFGQYCGGSGAGACQNPLGTVGTTLQYRVPKEIVFNRRIVFQNLGIQFFNDAGFDGTCTHSLGASETAFYIALSKDGLLTNDQIVAKNNRLSGYGPYNIEFSSLQIPQPKDAGWAYKIYVQLYWGDPALMNTGGSPITVQMLKIVKHDYDMKL